MYMYIYVHICTSMITSLRLITNKVRQYSTTCFQLRWPGLHMYMEAVCQCPQYFISYLEDGNAKVRLHLTSYPPGGGAECSRPGGR